MAAASGALFPAASRDVEFTGGGAAIAAGGARRCLPEVVTTKRDSFVDGTADRAGSIVLGAGEYVRPGVVVRVFVVVSLGRLIFHM